MLQKLSEIPILAYTSIKNFVWSLKKDERGLSGVVVAILLILVAVLAVVIIWGFLEGWLNDLWLQIIGEVNKIEIKE